MKSPKNIALNNNVCLTRAYTLQENVIDHLKILKSIMWKLVSLEPWCLLINWEVRYRFTCPGWIRCPNQSCVSSLLAHNDCENSCVTVMLVHIHTNLSWTPFSVGKSRQFQWSNNKHFWVTISGLCDNWVIIIKAVLQLLTSNTSTSCYYLKFSSENCHSSHHNFHLMKLGNK